MSLDELTPWLFARTSGGIRWGLERTEELLAGVGDPHRLFRSVHIGGTNGKGSVAALCESALLARANGGRIGMYTSPHLISFAERVRVDGRPVPEEVLAEAARRLRPEIERTGATFFEATTAIAFLVFAEAEVDVAVVEVGLGGRLDSTNVLWPLVTAVTNIAMDHAEYLGDTLESIAAEKAGIFKPGVPAISGLEDAALEEVLRSRAAGVGAVFKSLDALVKLDAMETGVWGTRATVESQAWGRLKLEIALPGEHQARNAMMAAEVLGALPAPMRPSRAELISGFDAARWPGRLQVERIRGTTWVLDVAHNAAGASTLANALPKMELPRPWVLIAGILADKGWTEMLPPLMRLADAVVLTVPTSAPAGRRWDAAAAASWAAESGFGAPRVIDDFDAALQRAETLAPHGSVIVTGSVHTVGDAMRRLGIPAVP